MAETIEYGDVCQEIRGCMNPGRLRLQSETIVFKNTKTGKLDHFSTNDIETASWLVRARGYCLKVRERSGTIHRFDGMQDQEFDRLDAFFKKNCQIGLDKVDTAIKGWNWGGAEFVGSAMNFNVANNLAFEIPLNNVSHTVANKNEVTVEFHPNDDAALSLMEIRFHIPQSSENPDADPVSEFYDSVMAKADIIHATGDAIAHFSEVQCLTPRGRYDIKLYPTFLQLHGKTFDYKIPYATILRLFLLPHKDQRQIFFIVSLDPPIKQGQTRYPFLILLYNKDDETTLELGLSEEQIEEKYKDKLLKEMSGPEYEIVSRLMKTLVGRKITVPGTFVGASGAQCVACSYKAASGYLYPLERGFIFVHKPPVHIRFDEISAIHFARSAGSTRSFDFDVETHAGGTYTFSSIEKGEYGKLYDFVSSKKLAVKNIGDKSGVVSSMDIDMSDSDEDGPETDAYLVKMKREGKGKTLDLGDDLGSSDDSSDESFRLPDGSDTDVELEWDSDAPSSSEESEEMSIDSDDSQYEARRHQKRKEKEQRRLQKRAEAKSRTPKERKPKAASGETGGTKRKRKTKKDKDPNKPKRAQSAYMQWLADNREKIKEDNPGISFTDIVKKAGEIWRTLSSEDKKPYEDKYAEDKKAYDQAMKEYNASGGGASMQKASKKKSSTKSPAKSPKKAAVIDTKAGSGSNYKSSEFVASDSSDDSDATPPPSSSDIGTDSSEDKPLKKRSRKDSGSAPKRRVSKRMAGDAESDAGSLPSEEEMLSSPSAGSSSDLDSE